jgi:hypothetical protein
MNRQPRWLTRTYQLISVSFIAWLNYSGSSGDRPEHWPSRRCEDGLCVGVAAATCAAGEADRRGDEEDGPRPFGFEPLPTAAEVFGPASYFEIFAASPLRE